jgi:hypothetical protein
MNKSRIFAKTRFNKIWKHHTGEKGFLKWQDFQEQILLCEAASGLRSRFGGVGSLRSTS